MKLSNTFPIHAPQCWHGDLMTAVQCPKSRLANIKFFLMIPIHWGVTKTLASNIWYVWVYLITGCQSLFSLLSIVLKFFHGRRITLGIPTWLIVSETSATLTSAAKISVANNPAMEISKSSPPVCLQPPDVKCTVLSCRNSCSILKCFVVLGKTSRRWGFLEMLLHLSRRCTSASLNLNCFWQIKWVICYPHFDPMDMLWVCSTHLTSFIIIASQMNWFSCQSDKASLQWIGCWRWE